MARSEQRRQLRLLVRRFLSNGARAREPLLQTLRDIRTHSQGAYLFGGTLRDLMVFGASARPRDVDIVVEGTSFDALSNLLTDRIARTTRFGGLHLDVRGWLFDVWPAHDTWAFREGLVAANGIWSLTQTTFLNVEAVVVELGARPGHPRRVYENGFFEAIGTQTLEINLEENPYPELCVIRALVAAARLQFSIGPRLGRYLVHYGKRFPADQLISVQKSHYGRVRCWQSEIEGWLDAIRQQLHSSRITLPVARNRQLELWADLTTGR